MDDIDEESPPIFYAYLLAFVAVLPPESPSTVLDFSEEKPYTEPTVMKNLSFLHEYIRYRCHSSCLLPRVGPIEFHVWIQNTVLLNFKKSFYNKELKSNKT